MAVTDTSGDNKAAPNKDAPGGEAPDQANVTGSTESRGILHGIASRLRSKYLLGGVALVLLAAAGGSGYLVLFTDLFNPDAIPPEPIITLKRVETLESKYIEIAPIIVRVHVEGGAPENIIFFVDLEVDSNPGANDLVKMFIPRLRDAYLRVLHLPPIRGVDARDSAIVDEARSRILTASADLLGEDIVRGIIVRDIK